MPEFNYNINSLYISVFILLYNVLYTNYNKIINLTKDFIILLGYNYITIFIIINIVGLYFFLRKLSFEINIKWTITYK